MMFAEGWSKIALSMLYEITSNTAQEGKECEQYRKKTYVVECRRARQKDINL